MLSYIIAKLDKLEDIIDEVAKLAKRHQGYGVTEEHYTAVGSALFWQIMTSLKLYRHLKFRF
jgi:hemoglobin-like flavoprotein